MEHSEMKGIKSRLNAVPRLKDEVSLFLGAKALQPDKSISLARYLTSVASSDWSGANLVKKIRYLHEEDPLRNEGQIKRLKNDLLCISTSAVLSTRGQTVALEEKVIRHTGFLQVDIDGKDHPDLAVGELAEKARSCPNLVAGFLSPKGDGFKAIALCPADVDQHLGSFLALEKWFAGVGITVDTTTKDITRLMYMSHDPDLWINADAIEVVPIEVPPEEAKPAATARNAARKSTGNKPAHLVNDIAPHEPEELILERAAKRFPGSFIRLCEEGRWEGKYQSHSDGDHALLAMLCSVTGSDEQVINIFNGSMMWREKAKRQDYLPRSIAKARRSIERGEFGTIHELNDVGNAGRLVTRFQDEIRFVPQWNTWLFWDGVGWRRDESGKVQELAKGLKGLVIDEAARARKDGGSKDGEADKLWKFATNSGNVARIVAALKLAESDPRIVARAADFDMDGFLLGVANGVVDLRTGALRPGRREDMITMQAAVTADPEATCPDFLWFLDDFAQGDSEVIAYLQRMAGYCLTGEVSEQCMLFAIGVGANGKSTLFGVLQAIMGDYAQAAPKSLFIADPRGSSATNDMARLKGKRMVLGSEVEQGTAWAESKIKDLTGGDTITARFLHQEFFDFRPTHKLIVFGNHKPRVGGTDEGIWRRIHLLLCKLNVRKEDRVSGYTEILLREAPGILNWMIQGAIQWQKVGLNAPAAIRKATEEYRGEEDHVGRFIEDCVVEDSGSRILKGVVFQTYRGWCEAVGEVAVSCQKFHPRMFAKGLSCTKEGKQYVGFSLREPSMPEVDF
ncbi:MAG: phage/plasmid primase, P4 family [Luteolibacter sp.]